MAWKLQSLLWKFLPVDRSVSFSVAIFGLFLALSLSACILGRLFKRRWLSRAATVAASVFILIWAALYLARPAWMRIAMQPVVPTPTISTFHWETQAPGLETADLDLTVGQAVVDRMVLVRLNPRHYRLSVHWDPTASRTAEAWQRELGAAVVVMGGYFSQ